MIFLNEIQYGFEHNQSYGAFPTWRGRVEPGPFLVAFPLCLVPARGYLFSGPTKSWFYRGQQTGLSRAEYAKLERIAGKGATTTTRWTYLTVI